MICMEQPPRSPRVNYGIDAPVQVFGFLVIALLGVGLGVSVSRGNWLHGEALRWTVTLSSITTGVVFLVTAIIMLWGSRVGKIRLVQEVIGQMEWRGDERVLD